MVGGHGVVQCLSLLGVGGVYVCVQLEKPGYELSGDLMRSVKLDTHNTRSSTNNGEIRLERDVRAALHNIKEHHGTCRFGLWMAMMRAVNPCSFWESIDTSYLFTYVFVRVCYKKCIQQPGNRKESKGRTKDRGFYRGLAFIKSRGRLFGSSA
jgi:hypothetical protein